MITKIMVCVAIAWLVCAVVLFIKEIKKAPLVDEDKAFLFHDYDPNTDPIDKFKVIFCNNCIKKLNGHCNNGTHFGKINDKVIKMCKKESLFEPK